MLPLTLLRNWRLIGAGLLLVFVVLAARHYRGLIREVAELNVAVEIQEAAVDSAVVVIGEWESSRADLLARFEEVERISREAGTETRRLNDLFAKHDLGKLASRKPGLIERRLNAGTAGAFRMLEKASGGVDSTD